ncbi:MAG: hypothetical protein COR54_16880 [Elusimicrobia bacterium CG22_combo_CG10-13_8_21_14_all_63_91]|nr:MAG: hypothetical protein COR54_16880 [Elusimicrobia bacterium CG22_combo_CG10-13_8_21_14_all_63_91]
MLTQILVAFGASSVALAVMAWLAKSLVSHLLDKDVEKHRLALQSENERMLTLHKAELDRASEEHRIRFGQLHAKVFVTIARLYRLIVQAHRSVQNYVKPFVMSGEPSEEDRGKKAADCLNALQEFFQEHEIYLEQELAEQVDKFICELGDAFIDFQHRNLKGDVLVWKAVMDKMKAEVVEIKKRLRDSFREKIGVKSKAA